MLLDASSDLRKDLLWWNVNTAAPDLKGYIGHWATKIQKMLNVLHHVANFSVQLEGPWETEATVNVAPDPNCSNCMLLNANLYCGECKNVAYYYEGCKVFHLSFY